MKKHLLLLILIAASATTFAQSVSLGIRGGANLATFASSNSQDYGKQSSITSFSAGVFADLKLGNISLQPGVFLTGKGGKIDLNSTNGGVKVTGNIKNTLLYVEVPVDLVYHIPVIVGNIYIGAGPYIAQGISGKIKGSATGYLISQPSFTQTMNIDQDPFKDNNYATYKSTDYGANFMAGFKFTGGFLVNVSYDLGLNNILSKSTILNSDVKLYTRTLSLSVGYAF